MTSTSTFNMAPSTRSVWSSSVRMVELHTLPASARRSVPLTCAVQRFVPLGVTVLDGDVTQSAVMDQARMPSPRPTHRREWHPVPPV
jgi:hypothetical protein